MMRRYITLVILLVVLLVTSSTLLACESPSEEQLLTSKEKSTPPSSREEEQAPGISPTPAPPQEQPPISEKESPQPPSTEDNETSEASPDQAQTQKDVTIIQDDFQEGGLDLSQWEQTSDGDFSKMIVDVQDVDPTKKTDFRLRLLANTIGTSDPVKSLGVMNKTLIDFSQGVMISFDLDWNNQRNGCYLTASMYLCPAKSKNPKKEKDWVKFEYVGVPPGQNVRTNIWANISGALKQLYTDWGPRDPDGRPQGIPKGHINHNIRILLDVSNIQIFEDGNELYPLSPHNLNFTTAYLYLQMSSGTNYPSREVYFDNLLVQNSSLGTTQRQ
jgi:hypothetical protein